jgi:hypothetical protein
MTVVAVPVRSWVTAPCVASTAPAPARPWDIEQTQQLHHPTSGLHGKPYNTPTPSRIPRFQAQPRPHALPRAAATEAAKTRLFEFVAPARPPRPSGEDTSAPTSPLRTGVPEWANSRILPAVRAAGAAAWRHLGLLPDGFRAERAHRRAMNQPDRRLHSESAQELPTGPGRGLPWVPRVGRRATMLPGAAERQDQEQRSCDSWTARRCRWQSSPAAPRRS